VTDVVVNCVCCQSVTVRGGRYLEAPLVGTLLQEQDNERQLPIVLTAGDFSLYEDCVPYFDSFTRKNFYLGTLSFLTISLILLLLFKFFYNKTLVELVTRSYQWSKIKLEDPR